MHARDDEALRWAAEFAGGAKGLECIRQLLQAGATPRDDWPESVRYRIEEVRQRSEMAAPRESDDEQAGNGCRIAGAVVGLRWQGSG